MVGDLHVYACTHILSLIDKGSMVLHATIYKTLLQAFLFTIVSMVIFHHSNMFDLPCYSVPITLEREFSITHSSDCVSVKYKPSSRV